VNLSTTSAISVLFPLFGSYPHKFSNIVSLSTAMAKTAWFETAIAALAIFLWSVSFRWP
jgi:hypothetical protein